MRVTNFLQSLPVRKETALKESAKILANVKRLMQSYALARPCVRFTLRVLKAKSGKGDFMYAPKQNSNVEDAVLKVIGKECAFQCDWTVMESDGFEIHAFLPKPDALGPRIANAGVFLSVDGRPVSTRRGTPKKIANVFKDRLRKVNPSCSSVKDPFICMNIICPPGSYDPNIEPAKDDILFDREDVVIGAATKLFTAYYPEAVIASNVEFDPASSASDSPFCGNIEEPPNCPVMDFPVLEEATTVLSMRPETAFSILEEAALIEDVGHSAYSNSPPRWRSTMYGIDEEDLELLDFENQPPVIEEEEEDERGAASVSNPWTIAGMNTHLKPKQSTRNLQLLTPAKGHGEVTMGSSSPLPTPKTRQIPPLEPLTPGTSSRVNMTRASPDLAIQQSIEPCLQASVQSNQVTQPDFLLITMCTDEGFNQCIDQENVRSERVPANRNTRFAVPMAKNSSLLSAPRRSGRNQQVSSDPQSLNAFEGRLDDNDWFGKHMRGRHTSTSSRSRRVRRAQGLDHPVPEFENVALPLTSENNTDIRQFLRRGRLSPQRSTSFEPMSGSTSFTPINRPSKQLGAWNAAQNKQQGSSADHGVMSRASSVEPTQCLRRGKNQPPYNSDSCESLDIAEQLRAYTECEAPPRRRFLERNTILSPNHATASRNAPAEAPRLPTARPSTTQNEMTAVFAAYSDAPDTPTEHTRPTRARRSQPPRKPLENRRTTAGPQRTKSSNLPLERVPHGHRIHNVFLEVSISTKEIKETMLKLNMQRNSVEWGYPADVSSYDGLEMRVTDGVLRAWVLRIDGMLKGFDTALDREEVLRTLERVIRGSLSERVKGGEGVSGGHARIGEAIEGTEERTDCSDQQTTPDEVATVPDTELETDDHTCSTRETGGDEFGEDPDDEILECV